MLTYILQLFSNKYFILVGVDCCEGPPVPIPNTEVKLISVEDTWLATPGKIDNADIVKTA